MSDKRGNKTDHPVPGILGFPSVDSQPPPPPAGSGVGVTRLVDDGKVRTFDTGATRDTEDGKLDFEAFLSPLVLKIYADYMHKHRKRSDGTMRDGDDWQRGIPTDVYMKSLMRHVMDLWLMHRGEPDESRANTDEALCGIIFNAMGYLFNYLMGR